MTIESGAGIVVTYHPDAEVLANLAALRPQVGTLIVVDNGSSAAVIAELEKAGRQLSFHLVINQDNLGIATALNIGVTRAVDLHCDWVLLFDQDSCIGGPFTEPMLETYALISTTRRVGILVPQYVDSRTRQSLPLMRLSDGTLATAITSGSMIAISTFQACGPFADGLFIDSVDHEYSLRVRKAGYIIALCDKAHLLHSPGTPKSHTLFGFIRFQSTNYSPVRRYYQERNKIWMYRRYARAFPGFSAKEVGRSVIDLLKILLVESDKQNKCQSFFRGIYDGLRGRMGKLEPYL